MLKNLNIIREESGEDTDMESIQERKEILMTEIEYILDTLLITEKRRGGTQGWSSKKGDHTQTKLRKNYKGGQK